MITFTLQYIKKIFYYFIFLFNYAVFEKKTTYFLLILKSTLIKISYVRFSMFSKVNKSLLKKYLPLISYNFYINS